LPLGDELFERGPPSAVAVQDQLDAPHAALTQNGGRLDRVFQAVGVAHRPEIDGGEIVAESQAGPLAAPVHLGVKQIEIGRIGNHSNAVRRDAPGHHPAFIPGERATMWVAAA
jgi:hypothetical protein